MSSLWSSLRSPVVLMAFGGWNDAGDAATNVLTHLRDRYPTEFVHDIDGEEFWDYQATRPMVRLSGGERHLSWPRITVSKVELPEQDIVLFEGPEPSLRWRSFTSLMISEVRSIAPRRVVLLGAMLSDAPHSRPLPLTGNSTDNELADKLGFEPSTYEGPAGIIGVLAEALERVDMPVVSLWSSVPHYVANPPSPKATMVLLNGLENVLGAPLDLGDLADDIVEWEQRVNELAEDDSEIADYIASLETMSDKVDSADGKGDEIAAAFEKYLEARGEDQ